MADPKFTIVKPSSEAEKATRTTLDTLLITPALVKKWEIPDFQRALRINEKVRALADVIKKDGGVIPGVITIGILNNVKYLLDGQHRREAFLLSGCSEGFVDVRMHFFTSMGEMGEEFVNLNSQLVRMRPDDILRGLSRSYPALESIKARCRFIGYDQIRRNTQTSHMLGMSTALRAWVGSATEVPASSTASAAQLAMNLTQDEADQLVTFYNLCFDSWGRDETNFRLWSGLNLGLCAWLYRRLVIVQYSPNTARLTKDEFRKCLMSVSADEKYSDWLVGRVMRERDRAPAYDRLKHIFAKRIEQEKGKKPRLPSPAWAHG